MRNATRFGGWFLGFLMMGSCTTSRPESIRVAFSVAAAKSRAVQSSALDYSCFGLLVTGVGIPSLVPGTGNRFPVNYCSYAGASSAFVTFSGGTEVEAFVPPGPQRRVQVVALDLGSAATCPQGTVAEFLAASHRGESFTSNYGGLYEVGSTVVDLFSDTVLQIANTYDSMDLKELRNCSNPPSTLQIVPAGPLSLEVMGKAQFVGVGGTGPYTFSTVNITGSAGAVSGTGLFTAVNSPSMVTDVLVTDSLGQTATTRVTTYAAPASAYAWFRAGDFLGSVSFGSSITSNWTNQAAAMPVVPTPGAGSLVFQPSGPNGFPVVRIQGGARFQTAAALGTSVTEATMFAVAKVNSGAGTVFCLSMTSSCIANNAIKLFADFSLSTISATMTGGGLSDTLTAALPLGNGFALYELTGDFASSSEITLTNGGSTDTGNYASFSGFAIAGGASETFFVGPADGAVVDLELAELILYTTKPTAPQQLALRSSLASKYRSSPPLILLPQGPITVETNGFVPFRVVGGTGPYTYTVAGSPGSLNTSTGVLTANSTPATTGTVTVTDSTGAAASTTVTTFNLPVAPYAWFTSSYYAGTADGTAISTNWIDRSGNAIGVVPVTSGGTIHFRTAGPNGWPVVHVDASSGPANLHTNSPPVATFNTLAGYAVVRLLGGNGSIFCVTSNASCQPGVQDTFSLFIGAGALGLLTTGNPVGNTLSAMLMHPTGFFITEFTATLLGSASAAVKVPSAVSMPVTIASSTAFTLGGMPYLFVGPSDSNSLNVQIAELILIHSAIGGGGAGGQRDQIVQYLAQKYHLPPVSVSP